MNINEYKKYLKSVHNTLDDPSFNNQMKDRLSESPVCDMKEYKPDQKKDKSSHEPTTASGDSLRPNSKTAEKMHSVKEGAADASAAGGRKQKKKVVVAKDGFEEGAADASAAGGKKKKVVIEEIEIPECVQQYFETYFGDNLNEDTSDEDIMEAVEDLVDLCEAVCDAVGLDEKTIKPKQKVQRHPGGSATIRRQGGTDTFVPPKYADSTRPIITLKIPASAKITKPQITPKIDASRLPVVGPGQPDYHQM
jgi:hypothetical protein